MKPRTTLVLLLLTGALVSFIVFHERGEPTTRERMTLQTQPFDFKAADADEIEIVRKDETLRLIMRNGAWRIGQPFDDPADPDLAKQVLEAMPAVEWIETMKRDDMRKDDLKRTGLGDDAVKLTVRKSGATLAEIAVGAPAALDGCVYASVPKRKDQLHIAKTTLPALLDKTHDEWRDPKLVRLKAEDIRQFTISAGAGTMDFTRAAGQPWQMAKPIQTRASNERVDAIVAAFLNLKVRPARGATPVAVAGSDLPVLKVRFACESIAKPVEITLHPNVDPAAEVQVQAANREGVFLAPAKVNDFWKLQPNHLRDQFFVRILAEQTTALRIRTATNPEVILDRKGDTWMLTRFGKIEPANQDRIRKLFDALNAAQVRDFLSDAAANLEPFGLHQPFLSIEWQAAGKTTVLQFGQGADGVIAARVTDEPFIYRVSASLFNSVPPDSIRWRGTKLVNTSIFAARRIIVAEGDKPALTLVHDPDDTSWSASIAGRDVTPVLDKARANQLLQKLVDFQVSDWSSDRTAAIIALKNPSLTVQLLLVEPGNRAAEPKPVTLTFAPTQPGMDTAIYHGRKDQEPDTFLISRDLYHELTMPLVR